MGRYVRYKPTQADHKVCTRCRQEKPRERFPPNKGTRDGLGSWCKPCLCEIMRIKYHADPEAARQRLRTYRMQRRLMLNISPQ